MDIPPTPERACGKRKQGGIYIEVALGQAPILPVQTWATEYAVTDPPTPAGHIILELPSGEIISADRLSARGQVVARRLDEQTWHVWDVVGRRDYPYPADFLEEVRTEGLSRRSPQSLRFDLLGQESRIFLLHDLGWIHPAEDYYARIPAFACPAGQTHPPGEMCAGLWWCDIPERDSEPVGDKTFLGLPMRKRRIAARTYRCAARPAGINPQHARALIASFPIWRLAVIRSADDAHEDSRQKAAQAELPVVVVEE